jgi:site-specific DNA recombinase
MEKLEASITNVSRFVEKAKRYSEIPELTGELLHLFIERIEVGERFARIL